jgi:hypothetical protein
MTGILLATYVGTIATLKDGSVKINLTTQELSPGKAAELFALRNKLCATYLSEKEAIPQRELDQVDKVEVELGGKTPSQRMRNVFWKLWDQDKEGHTEFDGYYKSKMELLIEQLKGRIK